MEYVLGIDVGTNATKTGLFDLGGRLVDLEHAEYPVDYPAEGRVEQDPEHWWNAITATVRRLVRRRGIKHDVRALSLSTQGGVTLLLDRSYGPLHPGISWLDARAMEIVPQLSRETSVEELYRSCGFPALGRLNLSQAVWFRLKRPDLFERCAHFASAVDYLNQRLTGIFAVDISNLAHNALLDMSSGDYSDRLLEVAGLSRQQLPEIIPSGTPVATVTRNAALELDLNPEVLVVSGAHDQYCASVGAGAAEVGDCVLSAGTAWALLATTDRPHFDEQYGVFPGIHVFQGRHGLMSAVSAGGNSLNWFREAFAGSTPFRKLDEAALGVEAGSLGLVFVPRLNAQSGRGAFLGIDNVHSLSHFARAVMEGVALFNQMSLERIRELGVPLRRLIMIGGGAKSTLWPQIVADMAKLPLFVPNQTEAPCVGAALLALTGAGFVDGIEAACRRLSDSGHTVEPNPSLGAVYTDLAVIVSDCLEHI